MAENISEKSSVWGRLWPAATFTIALVVLVFLFYDSDGIQEVRPAEITAKARYDVAKNVLNNLMRQNDVSSEKWSSLAQEFYAIYDEYKAWPNRPAALFRSALALESLAKKTKNEKDYTLAINCYLKLVSEFNNSRLADDALLQAAILQSDELKNAEKALELLHYMRKSFPKGDMYHAAMALEKKLSAQATVSKKRPQPVASTNTVQVKQDKPKHVALTQVSWATLDKHTVQVTVALNKDTTWRVSKSQGGGQLLLTMDNTLPAKGVHSGARIKNSVLKQLAITHQERGSTVLKLDFEHLSSYHTKIEKNPFSIVLTAMAKTSQKNIAVASTKKTQAKPAMVATKKVIEAKPAKNTKPVKKVMAKAAIDESNAKKATNNTIKKAAVQKKPTAKELSKRVHNANTNNMALQLGLRVQTVFIDVGHGGRDPGAIGHGIVERDIVLDTALRLGKILKANGLKVVYSRTADVSVPLSARPTQANKAVADLFVSIHINANEDKRVQGFETYYLNFAKNTQAAQTAALENATSDRKLGDMQSLLANVMLNVRTTESSDLAGDVQHYTMSQLKNSGFSTKNGGTRSAPFHVLIGTNMPAILVELGYCSNKQEASYLKQAKYRQSLAQGIAQGIVAYKKRFEKSVHFALTDNNDDAM